MSKQTETKKTDKKKTLKPIFFCAVILILLGILSPLCIRRINITRNMKNVYADANFVSVKGIALPMNKETRDSLHWTSEDYADKNLYYFTITDSKDDCGYGLADFWGNVIADSYCGSYYFQNKEDEFLGIVDFENNFPELECYVLDTDSYDLYRFVRTKDCSSYENYKNAPLVAAGVGSARIGYYPSLEVGISTDSNETVYEIDQYLRKADFDVYIDYVEITDKFDPEAYVEEGYGDMRLGKYYPLGGWYLYTKMGQSYPLESQKEKDSEFLIVEISVNEAPYETYLVFCNGTIVKTVYESPSEYTEYEKELSDEDYLTLFTFTFASECDIQDFVYTSITGEGDKTYKFTARSEGESGHIADEELYLMDHEDEKTGPILDILRGYFE